MCNNTADVSITSLEPVDECLSEDPVPWQYRTAPRKELCSMYYYGDNHSIIRPSDACSHTQCWTGLGTEATYLVYEAVLVSGLDTAAPVLTQCTHQS